MNSRLDGEKRTLLPDYLLCTKNPCNWQSDETSLPVLTDSGPASDIKLATVEPMFPQVAKKMRRFIGLLKCEENM
jgi:hypothetical protein